ncbi:MAG: hypothetical protein E7370_02185 [Clostridiales bacterium]|nr:hypothetical protein [Clostridiales bacterium]
MFNKKICFFMAALFAVPTFLFSACAQPPKSIDSAYFNDNGELIIKYSDNTTENLGIVNGNEENSPVSCTHNYGQWQTILAPTCESIGYDTCTCNSCGDKQYRFTEATGHLYGNPIDLINNSEKHIAYKVCSKCEDTYVEEYEVDSLDYENIYYGVEDGNGDINPFQYMDIHVPEGLEEEENVPVVVTIHGGNWSHYYDEAGNPIKEWNVNKSAYNYVTDFIVNSQDDSTLSGCNFVHVTINYRPLYCMVENPYGYAQYTYMNGRSGYAQNYTDMLEDIGLAIDYLTNNADQYHINPEKIALMGYSAGGHLALLYAYSNPKQIKCVVSEAGPTHFVNFDNFVYPLDSTVAAMVGVEFRGADYIYDPTNVYNPNLDRDVADVEELKKASPLWVANNFDFSQQIKPAEERISLPYTILAYGGGDVDGNGYIDVNTSDGAIPFIQCKEMYTELTDKNSTCFELINVHHNSYGSNKLIYPASENELSKSYYYGKDDGNGNKIPGLQQLLIEHLS